MCLVLFDEQQQYILNSLIGTSRQLKTILLNCHCPAKLSSLRSPQTNIFGQYGPIFSWRIWLSFVVQKGHF